MMMSNFLVSRAGDNAVPGGIDRHELDLHGLGHFLGDVDVETDEIAFLVGHLKRHVAGFEPDPNLPLLEDLFQGRHLDQVHTGVGFSLLLLQCGAYGLVDHGLNVGLVDLGLLLLLCAACEHEHQDSGYRCQHTPGLPLFFHHFASSPGFELALTEP